MAELCGIILIINIDMDDSAALLSKSLENQADIFRAL